MHTFLQFFVSLQPYLIVHANLEAMHNFELHPEFYNRPVLLTEEERRAPLTSIKCFFENMKLIEVRIHLQNLLEVALTCSNTIYDEADNRDAILAFCKQLEKLVESSSLLI
jgi:hypothetical protein